jgi:hypothetical protein
VSLHEYLSGRLIDGGQPHRGFRRAEDDKEKAGATRLDPANRPNLRRLVWGKTECSDGIRDRPLSRGRIFQVNHRLCHAS